MTKRFRCSDATLARITEARKRLVLTQAELGNRLGVTRPMVSQWESGVRHPEPATLQKIAKALGVSVDWLVHGSEARAYSPEALATRLQELRESLGLTQEAFGAHVGVSRSMIAHWEGLVRQIGLPNLVRVAQGTGASLDWLVFGTGSMTSASTSLPKASEKEMRKVTSAMIDPTP